MNDVSKLAVLHDLLAQARERSTIEFTRSELDELLITKLPSLLKPEQKANKVGNLLQSMRRSGLMQPVGPRTSAVWFLSKTGVGEMSFS
ncbi:MAG: hypothetical protein RLZZ591_2011 [Pseudomonadota bacterium]|jgi:hypothetical protein